MELLTTKGLQDQALQLLYGADGAHFAWGRIPMGASDYAMDRYTLDETPNDTAMSGFSIARDKQKLILTSRRRRLCGPISVSGPALDATYLDEVEPLPDTW